MRVFLAIRLWVFSLRVGREVETGKIFTWLVCRIIRKATVVFYPMECAVD